MPGKRTYTYETMFLFSQAAGANLADALEHVKELLGRAHAEYYTSQYLFFRGDLAFLERDVRIEKYLERIIDGVLTPAVRGSCPDLGG